MPNENETEHTKFTEKHLTHTIGKKLAVGVVTGIEMAGVMAIPDKIMHLSHTSDKLSFSRNFTATLSTTAALCVAGYLKSFKTSAPLATIKSTTLNLGQDKNVHDAFKNKNANSKYKIPDWLGTVGIAYGVSTLDTSLTQYFAVKGVIGREKALAEQEGRLYEPPQPKSVIEHFKMGKTGYALRNTRNAFGVMGFLSQNKVKEELDQRFPKIKNYNSYLASGMTAGPVVVAKNIPDLLFKKKAISLNKKYQSLSAIELGKQMVKSSGRKVFLKGIIPSLGYTALGFNILPRAQKAAEYVIDRGVELMNSKPKISK